MKTRAFWDDALSYSTVKICKIHDWRLGALHYGFMIGILLYVFVYAVYWNQGYLQKDVPVGNIRTSIGTPPDSVGLQTSNNYPYCLESQAQSNGFNNLPCIYYSGNSVQIPDGLSNPFLLVTRTKNHTLNNAGADCPVNTQPSCIVTDAQAANNTLGTTVRYFTAGIEDYTLYLEHTVFGKSSGFVGRNADMTGGFYDRDTGKYISPTTNRTGDIITIRDLLKLAGVNSLDVASGLGNTYRYDGVQIMVLLEYSSRLSNSSHFEYKITARLIQGVDTALYAPDDEVTSSVLSRYGVMVGFVQTGTIGVFSFPALLTAIIGGAVLVGAATTLVDLMALYILPEKKFYTMRKFDDNDANERRKYEEEETKAKFEEQERKSARELVTVDISKSPEAV